MTAFCGPTPPAARALAPDLARGAMLLLIALANVHLFGYGHDLGVRGYPVEQDVADRAVTLVQMTLVDGRAYPMFGALFGYGIVQLLRRHSAGAAAGRSLVRRRAGWLIVIGFGHALLLFSADIIGAYGLLGLALAGMLVSSPDRRLLLVAAAWLPGTAVYGAVMGVPLPPGQQATFVSMTLLDPLLAAGVRVVEWVALGLLQVLGVLAAVLLGAWAGRRRLLDDPGEHRSLLRRTAVVGIAVAVAGGLPMALMSATVWPDPPIVLRVGAGALHALTGYAGGIAYAAVAGLIVVRIGSRRSPLITALAACGERSMTCYLAQSVVFVTLLAAYGGGLGNRVGVAAGSLVAAGTWVATVIAAEIMRRRRYRGPAEVLLRRLTYLRPLRPDPTDDAEDRPASFPTRRDHRSTTWPGRHESRALERFRWGSVFLLAVPVMGLLLLVGPALLPEYRNADAGRLDPDQRGALARRCAADRLRHQGARCRCHRNPARCWGRLEDNLAQERRRVERELVASTGSGSSGFPCGVRPSWRCLFVG